MAATDPYITSSFRISAQIGDVVFPDVVSIRASFGLNSIPTATLTVATGKEVRSGEPATIHKQRKDLQPGALAIVTLSVTNHDGRTSMMDAGTYVIFRGKYAGIGYQRSHNSANYALQLVHWLDDVNQGSMVNGNWFPGAPYDLAQNAGYYALQNTEGTAGADKEHSPIPSLDSRGEIINIDNISTDIWGNVMYPIFKKIASWPLPRYQDDAAVPTYDQKQPVLDALQRMTKDGPGRDYYVPLGLALEDLKTANVSWAVKQAIAKDATESFAYTTFWNKLVGEYAPQFYFAISPSAEFALPIPFFAGLRVPYLTILADEYNYANFNASVLQQLESVDIFYSTNADTGYQIGARRDFKPLPTFKLPLGFYPPTDAPGRNIRGFKLLKEPPTWMTNITPNSSFAPRATGTAGSPKDTTTPRGGARTTAEDLYTAPEATIAQQTSAAATKFAEHWYKTEVLYQRHGELSGKLRFDIAPGSIIGIQTPPMDLEDPDVLYATVTQVAFAIDAERATAGTSFTVAHIRTTEENENTTLTSDAPPLYKNAWAGGPLAIRS